MLTISVKNFGPIAEGSVDLKPLTIFVGPSNTGKSYMATAVHTVTNGFANTLSWRRFEFRLGDEYDEFRSSIQRIREWVVGLDDDEAIQGKIDVTRLPEPFQAEVQESNQRILNHIRDDILRRLRIVLDLTDSVESSENTHLSVHRDEPRLAMNLDMASESVTRVDFDYSPDTFELSEPLPGQYDDDDDFLLLLSTLELKISEFVYAGMFQKSFYLPAARSGMAQSHRALSGAVIRQASSVGIRSISIPSLSDIVAEFLSNLITINSRMKNGGHPELERAIDYIESTVLLGQIDLDQSGGLPYPDIAYKTSNGKFMIHQASSMVAELSPLILFLKYLVRPGDLLVLEEPESGLHPAAQRQLARGIARLVNAGVKVLITTHSDIFVSQINNLLRASYASKRWLREKGFAPEETLKHDDVSAYLFRVDENAGGSRTEELEIQRDIGIDNPEFTKAINELYDETLLVERVRPK